MPNISWSLHKLAFWDIYYEHYLYFNNNSLSYLFNLCKIDIIETQKVFDGQYIGLIGRFQPQKKEGKESYISKKSSGCVKEIEFFSTHYPQMIAILQQEIEDLIFSKRCRVVIWGAGAQAVTILNMLNIEAKQLEFVVDINPIKHGAYLPGTGQKIVSPEFLLSYKPDVIIVMNPLYFLEIKAMIQKMNLPAELRLLEINQGVKFSEDN